jgi:flavin reductase (DIM6/NTAB) family NADH-FMN oxidoreductase RutF
MINQNTHLSKNVLLELDSRKRANLINSLTGFKSIGLIGTKNKAGTNNLAIFNSFVHLGANPALLGFISRPDAHLRHTVSNILETKYFTVNHINEEIYKQAHQTSARYPEETSEFDACGLSREFKDGFYAPFVLESHIQVALELREIVELKINNTSLVIGEILGVYFNDTLWDEDGYLDIEKAGSLAGSGLDGYHKTVQLERLSYAKPIL